MHEHSELISWRDLPVAAQHDIEAQPHRPLCGCHSHDGGWWLCEYHRGMVEGMRLVGRLGMRAVFGESAHD